MESCKIDISRQPLTYCFLSPIALGILFAQDVKRCLCADQHLRRRRQEVRAEIRGRMEARRSHEFIEDACGGAPPLPRFFAQ